MAKNEILKGEDELSAWFNDLSGLSVIDGRNPAIVKKCSEVLRFLQNSPLYSEKALRNWSGVNVADPWLIVAGSALNYKIVTFEERQGNITENSPSGNPKIPDVAKEFQVECVNLFYFMRKMKISWE